MPDPASVIRVLLVDDEQMARSAFSASVEAFDDLHLAGACVEGGEACTFVDDNPVDVVLMDLHMPGVNGVEATRTIRKAHPDVRILILTTFDEDEMVDRALTGDASGYLLKSVSPHTLAGAVRAAHGGLQVLAAEPARRRVDSIRAFPSAGIQLTDRERHPRCAAAWHVQRRDRHRAVHVAVDGQGHRPHPDAKTGCAESPRGGGSPGPRARARQVCLSTTIRWPHIKGGGR